MDLSSIRKISRFAKCGFFERVKNPQIVCPDVVELLIKYSSNDKILNNINEIKLYVSLI